MQFTLESHPGVVFVDPIIRTHKTIDCSNTETFVPIVIIEGPNYNVQHRLPDQPYVNGTWTDVDRDNAIQAYFQSISE